MTGEWTHRIKVRDPDALSGAGSLPDSELWAQRGGSGTLGTVATRLGPGLGYSWPSHT